MIAGPARHPGEPSGGSKCSPMNRSAPVDGFSLAYIDRLAASPRVGRSSTAVLLHGWPGDSSDYRHVIALLDPTVRVVAPDLRGFGESDRHLWEPDTYYSPAAQARSVAALIRELDLDRPVLAGYDIGSRVAQTLAAEHPALVGALALSPPLPGAGHRVLDAAIVPELWYQSFHRSPVAVELIDGRPDAVRAYLRHFWNHWSGPDYLVDTPEFDALVDRYARPGAFDAATRWYRVGGGYLSNALAEQPPAPSARLRTPVRVLWQQLDPLFPRSLADRLDEFFTDVTIHYADGVGHFTPLEAAEAFSATVAAALASARSSGTG